MTIKHHQLKQLTFTTTLTETAQLELTSEASKEIDKTVELAEYNLEPITIMVGFVPVVIIPKITLDVNLNGKISVGVKADVTQQITLTAGASYNNGQWIPINYFSNEFQFSPPELSAGATLKLSAGPQLSLLIYDSVGPTIWIDGYLDLESDVFSVPWWTLYGGLEANVGIRIEVLSRIMADYNAEVIGYRKVLAQAATPTPTPTPTLTPTPTPTVFPPINNFIGTWQNSDSNTNSWTKILITSEGDILSTHVWGKCHPTDCDAGVASANYEGNPVLMFIDPGFATMNFTLLLEGSTLHVTTFIHYTDNSGRQDQTEEDFFYKSTASPTVIPTPTPTTTTSTCYPNLPALHIALKSVVQRDGGKEYDFEITNWESFPDELFTLASYLPPCGLNPNASRTWLEIYDNLNNYIYGFCAFTAASELTKPWFFISNSGVTPSSFYIKLRDRECNVTYTSNSISLTTSTPTPTPTPTTTPTSTSGDRAPTCWIYYWDGTTYVSDVDKYRSVSSDFTVYVYGYDFDGTIVRCQYFTYDNLNNVLISNYTTAFSTPSNEVRMYPLHISVGSGKDFPTRGSHSCSLYARLQDDKGVWSDQSVAIYNVAY